jgi:TRAP-type C4-dicarboxylate transport system permease small subunit
MVQTVINKYCQLLSYLIAAALAVMVVLVFGNVVMRYAFNSGLTLSEELSRWLFVWVTFLGAIVALNDGAHLGTDMLVSRLSVRGKKSCLLIGLLLMLFVCWLMFKGSLDQVKINLESTSAVMEVPMAWFYASGLVFAVSATVIVLNQLWRLATGQLSEDELIGIRESEEEPIDVPKPLQ